MRAVLTLPLSKAEVEAILQEERVAE